MSAAITREHATRAAQQPWITILALASWSLLTWLAVQGAALHVLHRGRFAFFDTSTTVQSVLVAVALCLVACIPLWVQYQRRQSLLGAAALAVAVALTTAGISVYGGTQLREGHITRPAQLAAWLLGNELCAADFTWTNRTFPDGRYILLRAHGDPGHFHAMTVAPPHLVLHSGDTSVASLVRFAAVS